MFFLSCLLPGVCDSRVQVGLKFTGRMVGRDGISALFVSVCLPCCRGGKRARVGLSSGLVLDGKQGRLPTLSVTPTEILAVLISAGI